MSWISEHWGELTAAAAVILPTLIQISPIKCNPWSALATAVGRALNREMLDKVDQLQQSLDTHIVEDAERNAKARRLRVLRFNDELIQGIRHTKEHFDEILDDITEYERYCHSNPLYKNNKAVLAIENVLRVYTKCERDNSFL